MALPYEDLFNGTQQGVYCNLVEIICKVGTETKHIYLNDCGTQLTFNGCVYLPVFFSLTEPDKASVEEGSGSFNIVGVTSEYVAYVQEADANEGIQLSAGLVKVVLNEAKDGVYVEGDDYVILPTEYEVSNVSMRSADGSMSLSLKTGGALGFVASKYKYTSTDFPGLSG